VIGIDSDGRMLKRELRERATPATISRFVLHQIDTGSEQLDRSAIAALAEKRRRTELAEAHRYRVNN
jgi:hypothetical protein